MLAIHDLCNAQVDLREVVDLDFGIDGLDVRRRFCCCGFCRSLRRRFEQRIKHFRIDALHQVLEGADGFRHRLQVSPCEVAFDAEQRSDFASQRRQDRCEIDRQAIEGAQQVAADVLQFLAVGRILRQLPRLLGVDVLVDLVGQRHDQADRLAELACLESFPDHRFLFGKAQAPAHRVVPGNGVAQLSAETLGDEARRAAADVDVLADQVRVHARNEILRIEVDIFHLGIQFGRDVITQPFRVHADLEVAQRRDACAARLRHFFTRHGDEAVHEHIGRHLQAGELQHRRPEQRVEIDDVLADEVVLLGRAVGHEGVIVALGFVEIILERREVAYRRIQPHIEILARRIRDLDAEIGSVAADVPVAQAFLAFQPFVCLVGHFRLQAVGRLRPFAQELDALRVGELEEEVLRRLQHRRGAGQRRIRVLQFGRRIHSAAYLARIAVLVLGAALRALALDVTVRQEHVLDGVVELLDGLGRNQPGVAQAAVDVLRQLMVFRRIGRMPVVEADVEAVEVLLAAGGNLCDEFLRRYASLLGGNHDRCAMRIVRANEVHLIALHALVADPDVSLDVLHDVADMECTIGVGKGGGDKQLAGRCRAHVVLVW